MILINSRFRYYNTLLDCYIEKDKVWTQHGLCNPYIPNGKCCLYFKIKGKQVPIARLLNSRFLVRLSVQAMPF